VRDQTLSRQPNWDNEATREAAPILKEIMMTHEQNQSCIDACKACADACDRCIQALRDDPSPALMTRCHALCLDSAAICRLAAGFMAYESEFVDLICQDCAEICKTCAEECSQFASRDYCRKCAEACSACAEECLKVGTAPLRPTYLLDGSQDYRATL
jgi:hypothetical protein